MSKNIRALSFRKGLEDNLFEKIVEQKNMHKDQSDDALQETADKFLIGKSVVLGTSTFYDFIKDENLKKKAFICNGTACLVSGKQEKVKEKLLNFFSEDEIGHVACIGHCHENSAVLYDNKTYSLDDEEDLKLLLDQKYKENAYSIGTNLEAPVLISQIESLSEWYQLLEKINREKNKSIEELQRSNLRGRGGAGFPFFIKLRSAKDAIGAQKYIVCNADEGDPGAFSDMYLMEHQPHKVLFGMMAAGLISGANYGVLYIRAEYPNSIRRIQEAIDQLYEENLLGENILGLGFDFKFKVIKGAGAYICGEESSLLNSIEGLRAEVRTRPPFPATEGLYGKPTVLSNVETFANLHWILEHGGKAYAALGKGKSTGTKLVSLDGFFKHPGIYELEMGTPIESVFYDVAGGFKQKIKGMQVGGPLGGIVPASKFKDLSLDFESFAEQGFLLGHASFVCIPENFPMIRFLNHLFEFTKLESCGKCFPCRIGSTRGYELLESAMKNGNQIDRQLFEDLLETMQLGSLCALGGGLPLPVKNALTYFEDELRTYFKS